MIKEILVACLVAHVAHASPQWNYWTYTQPVVHQPVVHQPLVYTQQWPVTYTYQHFKAALTGTLGTQKVTTYNKVIPYAVDFEDPRFFIEFCEPPNRYFGLGFHAMDKNNDGKVSFNEMSELTNADESDWRTFMYTIETELQDEIQEEEGDYELMFAYTQQLAQTRFNDYDKNNDNILDMNEFFGYLSMIQDAVAFYFRALKDSNGDNNLISQNEWDCTHDQIEDDDCDPDKYDQTLISGMIGNNGDSALTFDEYRNVMSFYKQVAQQFEKFEYFCQGNQLENSGYLD